MARVQHRLPRLLIFSHSGVVGGGGEGALLEFIDSLRDSLDIRVVVPHEGELANILASKNIGYEVIAIPWWTKASVADDAYAYKVSSAMDGLSNFIQSFDPDVCMTNTTVLPWGAVAANAAGIPHVWFVHELIDELSEIAYALPLDVTKRIIGDVSSLVVVNSEYCRMTLREEVDDDHMLTLLPIAHLKDIRQKADTALPELYKKLPKGDPIILVPGRVLTNKGQIDAVEAVASLAASGIDVQLVMLGDTDAHYMQEILSYAKDKGVDRQIHHHPFVSNPYPYIKHADIIVSTSRLESFGRITLEAMYLGTPVIGADNSSTVDIIRPDRHNGLTYNTGNGGDLARKIKKILKDDVTKSDIIKGGRRYAEEEYASVHASLGAIHRFITEKSHEPTRRVHSAPLLLVNMVLVGATAHSREIAGAKKDDRVKRLRRYMRATGSRVKRKIGGYGAK